MWSLVELMDDAVEKRNGEVIFVAATVRFMLLLKCYCNMSDRLVAFLNVNGNDCSFIIIEWNWHSYIEITRMLRTKWTHAYFDQNFRHLQRCYMFGLVLILLYLILHFTVSNLCILTSLKMTHIWPKHVWVLFFYVLLTVHLSIFISVFNQLDAQNVFGIITPIGVMIPEAVWCNFDLLMMSTCSRNL